MLRRIIAPFAAAFHRFRRIPWQWWLEDLDIAAAVREQVKRTFEDRVVGRGDDLAGSWTPSLPLGVAPSVGPVKSRELSHKITTQQRPHSIRASNVT